MDKAIHWKEESIKTRIETLYSLAILFATIAIEKKNPLKQGLKLFEFASTSATSFDWKEESIKTRIETNRSPPYTRLKYIEKKNPLKQGLKLSFTFTPTPTWRIEKKNPLKQGLKPKMKEPEFQNL